MAESSVGENGIVSTEADMDAILNTSIDQNQLNAIVGNLEKLEHEPLVRINGAGAVDPSSHSSTEGASHCGGPTNHTNRVVASSPGILNAESCSGNSSAVGSASASVVVVQRPSSAGSSSSGPPFGPGIAGLRSNAIGTPPPSGTVVPLTMSTPDRKPVPLLPAGAPRPGGATVTPIRLAPMPQCSASSVSGVVNGLLAPNVGVQSPSVVAMLTRPGGAGSAPTALRPGPPTQIQLVMRGDAGTGVVGLAPRPGSRMVAMTTGPVNQQSVRIVQTAPQPQGALMQPGQFQLPPGTFVMKNEQGQLIVVQANAQVNNPNVRQVLRPAVSMPLQSSMNGPPLQLNAMPVNAVTAGLRPGQVASGSLPMVGSNNVPPSSAVRLLVSSAPTTAVGTVSPMTIVRTAPPPTTSSVGAIRPAAVASMLAASDVDNVKKCKNFLATLIRLAAKQPPETLNTVTRLIQNLVDSVIEPEEFTAELQKALKSLPQPYLVPFLKKSLPLLRLSLALNKIKIDGLRPPTLPVNSSAVVTPAPAPLPQPTATSAPAMRGITPQQFQMLLQQQHQNRLALQASATGVALRPQPARPILPAAARQLVGGPLPTRVLVPGAIGGPVVPASLGPSMRPHLPGAASFRTPLPVTSASAGPYIQRQEKRKYDAIRDDDDINDVATMGGVNLSEESRNILATNSGLVSGQLQSCKDEAFLDLSLLTSRIQQIAQRHGIDQISSDVAALVSHAVETRLRTILEKLSVVAEHRSEIYRNNSKFEVTSETKVQVKFLAEIDALERKRHEDSERETLLRMAKSRSKSEDPEQLRLKEKGKALHQAQLEQLHQQEANMTALAAIGPRKARKLDAAGVQPSSSGSFTSLSAPLTRVKRVNLRDVVFVMEQDQWLCRSDLLYRAVHK